jgi:Uma2 family endonuclease
MTAQMPISTTSQPARLSARDFWLLADGGAFVGCVKAELIEGEVLVVNAVHSRHARCQAALTVELGIALRAVASPLVLLSTPSADLGSDSVPEPDIALATAADGRAVALGDLVLAVEVSDSTLDFDLGRKLRLYARTGVPEYWVADVEGPVIHQHWAPVDESYTRTARMPFGEPLVLASHSLTVDTASLR